MNKVSHYVTKPTSQGTSQAVLYAIGFSEKDMDKAQVAISSAGVEKVGLKGMQFDTVSVSNAISMGTKDMRYSL
ncbi:hypothetical protein BDV23DRAFT_187811 [Aspergillus alliaceus]|uniref:Uncharacterized protein n=1 Tax=Petromyces alliaceus TaxID=209559 RepID=A0A5N7BWN7_PETAA|nr:hypothetical protein BDV23DRAFT_187811 [Aspergillus alliaceus]